MCSIQSGGVVVIAGTGAGLFCDSLVCAAGALIGTISKFCHDLLAHFILIQAIAGNGDVGILAVKQGAFCKQVVKTLVWPFGDAAGFVVGCTAQTVYRLRARYSRQTKPEASAQT